MEKIFTRKLSCLALGLLAISPVLNAQKVDYTDYLKNPSFENYLDGTPIDVTNTSDTHLVSGALRGTPPGWQDTGVTPPATGNLSYGINRNAIGKDGFNACFCAPTPFPADYALSQKVEGLPAGQYVISARLWVSSARLTNQRLFVQTESDGTVTNNIVQYFGTESQYPSNLTNGETNTFAGWEMNSSTSDGESRLKPMSITVTVAEGETLVLGVRSSNLGPDGTRYTNQNGFFKVDNFHITKVVSPDPNDYTSKIVNPSFELALINGVPTQLKTHNIAAYSATDPQRGLPYGWNETVVDANPIGTSYGVNSDANGVDGAKHMWVIRTPFMTSYTIYQDINELPAGKYKVSCSMFVQSGKLGTQRLFANNKVQYYGSSFEYLLNLTDGEDATYAGYTASSNGYADGLFLKDLSVEVDVLAGQPLRIGVKSSGAKADGSIGTDTDGWFKLDNFRLKRIDNANGIQKGAGSGFAISPAKGGFFLNKESDALATVKVFSATGQTVYSGQLKDASTWIPLSKGFYIVSFGNGSIAKSEKVLVK